MGPSLKRKAKMGRGKKKINKKQFPFLKMRRKINGFLTHLLFVSEGSRKKNEQKIATKLKKTLFEDGRQEKNRVLGG